MTLDMRVSSSRPSRITGVSNFQLIDLITSYILIYSKHRKVTNTESSNSDVPLPLLPIVCKTSCQHFSVLGSHTLVLHVQILQASNAMVRYAMYIPRQKSTQLYLCSYNTTLPHSNPVILEICMPQGIGVLLLFLSVSTFLLISICIEADTNGICPRHCIGLSANYSGQFFFEAAYALAYTRQQASVKFLVKKLSFLFKSTLPGYPL